MKLDLRHLLEDAVKKVNGLAIKKSVNIHLQIENTILIKADEEKLLQAFINILSNCIRHANNHIHIVVIREKQTCLVYISDDGHGFSDEDLTHLFERFYKGNNGSTGLGMTITKSIINKLGDAVTAQSREWGQVRVDVEFNSEEVVPDRLQKPGFVDATISGYAGSGREGRLGLRLVPVSGSSRRRHSSNDANRT